MHEIRMRLYLGLQKKWYWDVSVSTICEFVANICMLT